ncbi:MAG: AmmeMemoRadiSam system radical SAM enzyme, partial [Myxococcales bacterium]|nr:AmmeMemoRadiSam system radical SAM enzyme [Myxococcales bacterium]
MREEIEPGVVRGSYWEATPDGRIRCDLCPRHCTLSEGQRGFCFVREARGGAVVLTSYGRAIGVCVDPIEKKPLYHFFPGSSALSFGTAGCNLGCRFCQNWDMSKARDVHGLSQVASPAALVASARQQGCRSIAYTYNDPIVFAEYAIDCAELARAEGISNVAVSNGFILGQAREDLYGRMDAINVDLKSFEPEFYRKLCAAKLEPVLETLEWIAQKTDVWLEVTTLVIPGLN